MFAVVDSENECVKGYLWKWTNYVRGYQKRWFVLENNLLSYYRNQAEVAHTCRGTINITNATVTKTDTQYFIISSRSNQTFHLKASNDIEQKKWVDALNRAKTKAIAMKKNDYDSCNDVSELSSDDEETVAAIETGNADGRKLIDKNLNSMHAQIDEIMKCNTILAQKAEEINSLISEIDAAPNPEQHLLKLKPKLSSYSTSNLALVNLCKTFAVCCRKQGNQWKRVYNAQHQRCELLDQMVEQLAKQLRQLENQVKHKTGSTPFTHVHNFSGQVTSDSFMCTDSCGPGLPVSATIDSLSESQTQGNLSTPPIIEPDFCMSPAVATSNSANEHSAKDITSDSEDDFYDAVDSFSVMMPSTNKTPISIPDDQSEGNDTDLDDQMLKEYESDVSYDDEGVKAPCRESENRKHSLRKCTQKLREIHVIPTKSGRSSTLTTKTIAKKDCHRNTCAKTSSDGVLPKRKKIDRRTCVPPRPNYSLNLWSIMKNCIGKELTKIPMPVNFSEPLSMLQRLTEDFEYSSLLDQAANCQDSCLAIAHIAAFTVSAYASTAVRTNKPFNPLLGETYECDRTDDLGWRSLAEQVSHHPPIAALHCESDLWYSWFEFSMSSKFRGKYLQIQPLGTCHLVLRRTGHHYTWRKIPMTVHNIIVGKLWIDNSGETELVNHSTGEKCHLTYKPYSYFSNEPPKRVTGAVADADDNPKYILNGAWDEYMEYAPVLSQTSRDQKDVIKTGPPVRVWECKPLPDGAERQYYFSDFTVTLNDPQEIEEVCPTDCRRRPDQQLMECGRWDEANEEKVRLEENQRTRRKLESANPPAPTVNSQSSISAEADINVPLEDQVHTPIWFRSEVDADTGKLTRVFTGDYWQCKAKKKWDACPDLYS